MRRFKPIIKNFDEILDDQEQVIFDRKEQKEPKSVKLNGLLENNKHSLSTKIGGSTQKRFFLCKTKSLKELIGELNNENCSYITCINEEIKNSLKSGEELPTSIPVLIKMVEFLNNYYIEEYCSKLANLFNVKTVYNKNFSNNGSHYSLSVDFIDKNSQFKTFDDLDCNKMSLYETTFSDVVGLLKKNNLKFNKKELKKDFVNQFIFRVFVICDGDFYSYNSGFLIDIETKMTRLAPCFDMEASMIGRGLLKNPFEVSNKDEIMLNLYLENKEEVVNFAKKSKYIIDNNLLCEDVFNKVRVNKYDNLKISKEDFLKNIKQNVVNFLQIYNKIVLNRERSAENIK